MLFIFYLISKWFDDGQVVCACVRRVNEQEACAAGAIENRQNLVLSFSLSLLPGGQGSITECISKNNWLFFLLLFFDLFFLNWTLERYLMPASPPNIRQVGNDPSQPESARSGGLARAQRERSGFTSWSTHTWLLSSSCFQIQRSTGLSVEEEQ